MGAVTRIEITFPEPVEIAPDTERALMATVDEICRDYEVENPDRIMWPAGWGGKPMGNWFVDDDIDFDMSVLAIECAERELYESERQDRGQPFPTNRDILAALDDYNSLLRSTNAIADRRGEETNWETFGKRCSEVLAKHHRTWRAVSPWLRQAKENADAPEPKDQSHA